MKLMHLYYLLITSLVLLSCKKELDEIPESNSPIFFINGTIGENVIDLKVDEGIANFESNELDVNGVKFFNGTLISSDFELEIGLFDGNLDQSSISVNDLKNLPQLSFIQTNSSDLFYANKYYFNNPQIISSIEWFVNGAFYCNNTISINQPGRYSICAKVIYIDQSENTICNDVILGYKKTAVFSLEYELESNNNLYAWIYEDNATVSSVSWYVDGQFECNCLVLTKQLDNQVHEIKANISFINGTKRTRTIIVDGDNDKKSIIDFAFLENLADVKNDFKAKIKYKEGGVEYSSDEVNNSDGKFEVKEIRYVGKDANANDVYCFKGTIQALVKSTTNNETKSINLDVSWGLILK